MLGNKGRSIIGRNELSWTSIKRLIVWIIGKSTLHNQRIITLILAAVYV